MQLSALLEREAPPRKLTLVPLVAKKIMMKQLQPRYLLQFKVGANVDENFIPPSVNTCTKVVVKKHNVSSKYNTSFLHTLRPKQGYSGAKP